MKKSSGTETSELEYDQVIQCLTSLMSSVKVTNPMAREEPIRSCEAMADQIVGKFQLQAIKAACYDLSMDANATWPTIGQMIQRCHDLDRSERAKKPRYQSEWHNIDGRTYAEIMNTKQGKLALLRGEPWSFLQEVRKGKILTSQLDFVS